MPAARAGLERSFTGSSWAAFRPFALCLSAALGPCLLLLMVLLRVQNHFQRSESCRKTAQLGLLTAILAIVSGVRTVLGTGFSPGCSRPWDEIQRAKPNGSDFGFSGTRPVAKHNAAFPPGRLLL